MSELAALVLEVSAGWRERAACKGGPEMIEADPKNKEQVSAAKAFCFRECPVVDECREWGISERRYDHINEVVGGLTAEQRRAARRRRAPRRRFVAGST